MWVFEVRKEMLRDGKGIRENVSKEIELRKG
jgi:hypothetical protein